MCGCAEKPTRPITRTLSGLVLTPWKTDAVADLIELDAVEVP